MTDDELFALTGLFYEGALSPESWQEGLKRLATMTSSQAVSLVLWDRRADRGLVGDQVGLPDELQREYAEHFHALDPGRDFVDGIDLGGWYLDERDLGIAHMKRSSFYQDFLRRYELDSTMASPFLRADHGVDGFLSLSSRPGQRDLAKVAGNLSRLMPHLQRAARLRVRFMELSQQLELSSQVLDRFHFPLLAVTSSRRVMLANRLGEEWLKMPGNPLATGSSYARQMAALLQDACGSGGTGKATGLRLRKPNGSMYHLTALPIPVQSKIAGYAPEPLALLLVHDPERGRQPASELLKQIFQLTPAEIRVIHPLLQGATMQETVAQLNISVDTGRTHLKSIFGKLGIRRQTELHRLLGGMDLVEIQ
jgi:DNA-binding CsgD family transcriptional regulator